MARSLLCPEGVAAVRALQFYLTTSPPAFFSTPPSLAVGSDRHGLPTGLARFRSHPLPPVPQPLQHHGDAGSLSGSATEANTSSVGRSIMSPPGPCTRLRACTDRSPVVSTESGAAVFPALATAWQAAWAPAQRSSLVVEARWLYPLRLRFLLLPLRGRPLGPRLSGVLWSLGPGGRIRFAFVSRSCLCVAHRPRLRTGFADTERIAPYLRSLSSSMGAKPPPPRQLVGSRYQVRSSRPWPAASSASSAKSLAARARSSSPVLSAAFSSSCWSSSKSAPPAII